DLPRLSYKRGKLIVDATSGAPGSMAAFDAAADVVETVIAGLGNATIANKNAPNQTVISGSEAQVQAALVKAKEHGILVRNIAVPRAFHSPLMAPAREPLAQALAEFCFCAPKCPIFSNTTATLYPSEPSEILTLLANHLTAPVRFHEEVLAMHAAGARVF